jgi:hypothetical protein
VAHLHPGLDAGEKLLVHHVVLANRSVSSWLRDRGETGLPAARAREMQRLVVCLDRLVEHFADEIETGRGGMIRAARFQPLPSTAAAPPAASEAEPRCLPFL